MTTFILRRLIIAVATLVLISLAVFTMLRVMPGNPACSDRFISKEQCAARKDELGLDAPYYPISMDTSDSGDWWAYVIPLLGVGGLLYVRRRARVAQPPTPNL